MGEYQYYEWQTIDRPLTASEQREVNGLSSHMDTVTSTQAIVTYSWGDFKHDPPKVLLTAFAVPVCCELGCTPMKTSAHLQAEIEH